MKRTLSIAILTIAVAIPAFAHGDFDHVRGTVMTITAQSIVVKTTGTETRTLTIDPKTVFQHGGKTAHAADVKVGDRVVIDVPKKTNRAEEVQFSTPVKAK